jgi:hypothetical protein
LQSRKRSYAWELLLCLEMFLKVEFSYHHRRAETCAVRHNGKHLIAPLASDRVSRRQDDRRRS